MYTIRFKDGRTANVGSKTARAMRSKHMPHTGVKQIAKDRAQVYERMGTPTPVSATKGNAYLNETIICTKPGWKRGHWRESKIARDHYGKIAAR